jgi:hypothetical protein
MTKEAASNADVHLENIFDSKRFSSEVATSSREENASKRKSGASVLIQSEPKL